MNRDPNEKIVFIKTAPPQRFNNEVEALGICRGHKAVRQLLDITDSPQSMVLEFMHKTLYAASCEQKLDRQDVKRAGKAALEGLSLMHEKKRVHTDKPECLPKKLVSYQLRQIDAQMSNRTIFS